MTTIYPYLGASGPWQCDDSQVACDGFLYPSGQYEPSQFSRGPTCNGLDFSTTQTPDPAWTTLTHNNKRGIAD